jgi:hypothetical protein
VVSFKISSKTREYIIKICYRGLWRAEVWQSRTLKIIQSFVTKWHMGEGRVLKSAKKVRRNILRASYTHFCRPGELFYEWQRDIKTIKKFILQTILGCTKYSSAKLVCHWNDAWKASIYKIISTKLANFKYHNHESRSFHK